MSHWEIIFNTISIPSTSILYIGIGTAQGHYSKITEQNNQQYPCFLEHFPEHKVILLIDPGLEFPLKLEKFMEDAGTKLVEEQVIKQISDKNEEKVIFRYLKNNKMSVFAINDSFEYEENKYMNDKQKIKTNENLANLIHMIELSLGKVRPNKIILQDYTGHDSANVYSSLCNIIDSELMMKHVLFDVTQLESGCFIDFQHDMISYDSDNNFIQERLQPLTKITKSSKFEKILKKRIDKLIYPVSWAVNQIKSNGKIPEEKYGHNFESDFRYLSQVYGLEYNELNFDLDYKKNKLEQLTQLMLQDIVEARECQKSELEFIKENLKNRSVFINFVSILKFED